MAVRRRGLALQAGCALALSLHVCFVLPLGLHSLLVLPLGFFLPPLSLFLLSLGLLLLSSGFLILSPSLLVLSLSLFLLSLSFLTLSSLYLRLCVRLFFPCSLPLFLLPLFSSASSPLLPLASTRDFTLHRLALLVSLSLFSIMVPSPFSLSLPLSIMVRCPL